MTPEQTHPEILISIQEVSQSGSFDGAYKITLVIERALQEIGVRYNMRNKSWSTAEHQHVGFEIRTTGQ